MIAALYVQADGCYAGLPGVECWPEDRDARTYIGPWPVVAHPPCQRWGRYSETHPIKGKFAETGDDQGCFEKALEAVRIWGGVLEHPAHSKAFKPEWFDLGCPPRGGGWINAMDGMGWICHVEQGHYGHLAAKPTWLYRVGKGVPENLIWGTVGQRIHPRALELHGYEKARRIGMMAMVGGKDKTRIREATPPAFRDVLVALAEAA